MYLALWPLVWGLLTIALHTPTQKDVAWRKGRCVTQCSSFHERHAMISNVTTSNVRPKWKHLVMQRRRLIQLGNLAGKSHHLMRIKFHFSLDIPWIIHCVIRFLGESLFNQDFVDVNFFNICVEEVDINRLIPRPVKTNTSDSSHFS